MGRINLADSFVGEDGARHVVCRVRAAFPSRQTEYQLVAHHDFAGHESVPVVITRFDGMGDDVAALLTRAVRCTAALPSPPTPAALRHATTALSDLYRLLQSHENAPKAFKCENDIKAFFELGGTLASGDVANLVLALPWARCMHALSYDNDSKHTMVKHGLHFLCELSEKVGTSHTEEQLHGFLCRTFHNMCTPETRPDCNRAIKPCEIVQRAYPHKSNLTHQAAVAALDNLNVRLTRNTVRRWEAPLTDISGRPLVSDAALCSSRFHVRGEIVSSSLVFGGQLIWPDVCDAGSSKRLSSPRSPATRPRQTVTAVATTLRLYMLNFAVCIGII